VDVRAGLRAVGLSLLAAAAAAAALLLIAGAYWLVRRRIGMGMGDVKLLAMLAAWLGLRQTALVLFQAVVVGASTGWERSCSIAGRSGRSTATRTVADSLRYHASLAGLYSIFLGQRTLGWYMQFFH